MATTSIIGTEEKFSVHIAPLNSLHAHDYNFSIKAYSNKQANLLIQKESCLFEDPDTFLICIDTSVLGLGQVTIEVTAQIPDPDLPDGYRTEIARVITDTLIIA